MIDAFNKATKKFTDLFTYIESEIDFNQKTVYDSVIKITERVCLWQYDCNYKDDESAQIFKEMFNFSNYLVYNITPRKIAFSKDMDKVKELKAPDYSSYTLSYLISFCLSAKEWLSVNEANAIVIHNDLKDGKVLCLLSVLLSYISKTSLHPMDAYSNIILIVSLIIVYLTLKKNQSIEDFVHRSEAKNCLRYLNYFSAVQTSPIVNMKKIYLKRILINSAPAIDNSEHSVFSTYVTINKNSFYCPVIRLTSNGSVIYCSYNKAKAVERVYYSPDNCIIFDVNAFLFADCIIEVLHKGDGVFKQLFAIQFHSFFVAETAIRFTRGQIDCACKDIRYPEEFFIDILFDQTKDVFLSQYDEESIKWKGLISELIVKSYKASDKQKAKDEDKKKEEEKMISPLKEEESCGTTVNRVQEMLNQFGKKGEDKEEGKVNKDEGDEDEVENYLQNLERQTK